jgi:hypothetical protein
MVTLRILSPGGSSPLSAGLRGVSSLATSIPSITRPKMV